MQAEATDSPATDALDWSLLEDEEFRINNLYFIKNKQGEKVRFNMNWAQRLLYQGMWYLSIVLKARQLGMTTFIQIFMLDRCLFNANTNAGVIAHNREDAAAFFDDKIKFAYDNLPAELRQAIPATSDSTNELSFANGSKIRCGTSMRSGTLQYLHISEFGKVCAKYPEKAKEIVTGALNTVAAGQFIWIESTAEGPHGAFYDMCLKSETFTERAKHGEARFTPMDYKFFFFPWWQHPEYRLKGENVAIPTHLLEYFDELEREEGIVIDHEQRAWYAKKEASQNEEMKQEYPATPAEAFQKLLKGVIFAEQLKAVRRDRRICDLPFERGIPVNTFWDLGRNDINALWFHQRVGPWDHFINYYESRLVDITHYIEILNEMERDLRYQWGIQYLPHDGKSKHIESIAGSAKDILQDNGFKVRVVDRPVIKNLSIEPTRRAFNRCRFDAVNCAEGIHHLESYKWIWDEKHETFRKIPDHNQASNGADAFQTFGFGYRGESGTFREQAEQHTGSGRKYARERGARNPLTNPSTDHIV